MHKSWIARIHSSTILPRYTISKYSNFIVQYPDDANKAAKKTAEWAVQSLENSKLEEALIEEGIENPTEGVSTTFVMYVSSKLIEVSTTFVMYVSSKLIEVSTTLVMYVSSK